MYHKISINQQITDNKLTYNTLKNTFNVISAQPCHVFIEVGAAWVDDESGIVAGRVLLGRTDVRNSCLIGLSLLCLVGCSSDDTFDPTRQNAVVRGVNYVGVSVSNIEEAVKLYSGATDLRLVEEAELADIEAIDRLAGRENVFAKTHLMKSVNAQIKFMEFTDRSEAANSTPPTPVNGPGIAHVCYQVDKETGTYQRFLSGGATHIGHQDMVQLNPDRPVEYAYVQDQDGIIVEVEHVDIPALNLPEPPKHQYRIRHVALATPDIDRAVDFYSTLLEEESPRRFGWWFWGLSSELIDKVSGLPDSEIKMAWFQIRNMELEIGEYLSHPVETPTTPKPIDALGYNMIVFDVSSIEAARAKFTEAGGVIVSDVEEMDGGQILFGRDPDGNLIGLQVLASDAPASSQNFNGNGT